jgi:hypothetical protein
LANVSWPAAPAYRRVTALQSAPDQIESGSGMLLTSVEYRECPKAARLRFVNRRDWIFIIVFVIVALVAMRFVGMAIATKP